jgi:glycosyltransferase involved in cell wall biosynthesis
VAHVTEAFCGGVLTYVKTILPRLVGCGCDVSLICSLKRQWQGMEQAVGELRRTGMTVHVVNMARGVRPWTDAISLARLTAILARGRFDVVHTHGSKAGCLGRVAGRLAGAAVVAHTPHCFAFLRGSGEARNRLYHGMERALGRLTDVLVGVSAMEAQLARALGTIPARRCVVLENPLEDLPRRDSDATKARRGLLAESFGIPPGRRVVTLAARLVPYKGVGAFVRAAGMCRSPDAVFLIAGEGPLRGAVEETIASLALADKVRLLGGVRDMDRLHDATDVAVSCSRAEGQSYAVLEAMRAGLAIVAADTEENRQLLRHGVSGWLVAPSPAYIAAAIDRLLADDKLRAALGAASREAFRSRPAPDLQAQRLSEIYLACLNEPMRRTPCRERLILA